MKKRKLAVVSFLAAAALTCGIGYAAVSDTLDMIGTFDVNGDINDYIYFSKAGADEKVGYTATITNDNDKATFTITGLKNKGNSITIPFEITNKGDLDAMVSVTTLPTDAEGIYKIETDWDAPKTLSARNEETSTDGKVVINLTITLLQTPTDALKDTFTVQLTATAGN